MIQQISGLTSFEYISLIGHYNKLVYDTPVDPRLLSRGYTKEQIAQMTSKMGKRPTEIISVNVHFKTNLDKFSVDYFNFVMVAFDIYDKHGVLPYPGSLSEQPNKIIEIFNVLSSLKQERDKRLMEEQEKEQKRNERRKR